MICNFCSTETELFFCPNCGKIIEYPQFIKGNAKLEKELTDYVQSLVYEARSKKLEVQEFVDKGTIAKEMFRKYYEHCLYLQELCANKRVAKSFASNGVSLFDTMMGFAQKCNNNECQIAVVGTVKAGKSMFINAILGREVASSYPTPETASLTKFRYSADGDYVKVSFYTKDEWTQLWNDVQDASKKSFRGEDDKDDFLSKYEELKAEEKRESLLDKPDEVFKPNTFEELQKTVATYSSCQYAEHFFAKEVEVGLSVFDVPQNVVFVDTPGLNDPVKFRSDISRKYINSANVVLLCISADKAAIESTELEQTATIFSALRYAKDRIYIFGTKIDMQSNFMDFWETYTKPEFVKYFSKKYLYGSKDLANDRIFPVTAYYYNLIQRAKNSKAIWEEESNDSEALEVMLTKCLKRSYRNQYKEKGLEACFYDSIPELEEKSNVPMITKMLKEKPIKDAEIIIMEDIRDMYRLIRDRLTEIADDTMEKRIDEIKHSSDSDIEEQISKLQAQIEEDEKNNPIAIKAVREALSSLSEIVNKVIDNVNK